MTERQGRLAATAACGLAALVIVLRVVPGLPAGLLPYQGPARAEMVALFQDNIDKEGDLALAEAARPGLAKALSLEPLSGFPVYVYGYFAGETANDAIDEALRRNPRHLGARLLRARRYLAAGRFVDTVGELSVLMGVDRGRMDAYLAALLEVATYEEGKAALLTELANEPFWAMKLVEELNEQSPDVQFLYQANKLTPEARPSFMRRLIRDRLYDLAFVAWLEFGGVKPADLSWPYNPRFEELESPPPFNWTLAANGHSELLRRGGLYVVHTSRDREIFAWQMMVLGPGTYDLKVAASGLLPAGTGDLAVVVTCRTETGENDGELAEILFTPSIETRHDDRARFRVPAEDCQFQRIDVVGKAGQFPQIARVEISEITITPVPDAQTEQGEG